MVYKAISQQGTLMPDDAAHSKEFFDSLEEADRALLEGLALLVPKEEPQGLDPTVSTQVREQTQN